MSKLKILIAVHKESPLPKNNIFLPIQVGSKLAKKRLNIQGDDEGTNISEKNPNYCELTALYWAWKNLKDIDYIGLNHYRRYFSDSENFQHSNIISESEFLIKIEKLKEPKNWEKHLGKFDIIKVKPFVYYHSVQSVLTNILSTDDLDLLEEIIRNKFPEYLKIYIDYMKYNNRISSCNMFITRFKIFDQYCTWLFDILFELEEKVHISKYPTPARIFGFLSEALFNIYCIKNNLNIKYYSIDVIRDDITSESNIVYFLKNIRRDISFLFNKPKK